LCLCRSGHATAFTEMFRPAKSADTSLDRRITALTWVTVS